MAVTQANLDAITALRPIARDIIDTVKLLPETTKHHYGDVLGIISASVPKKAQLTVIAAMIQEGYPKETAISIARMLQ